MKLRIKTQKPPVFLLIVYAVYFLYYFADMATSANTMVKQTESRENVHLFLMVLIGLLALYFLFRTKWKLDDPFRLSFLCMIVWTVIVDVVIGAQFWGIATHVGLLVLFYFVYYFAGHYINSAHRYRLVLILECVLWIVTMYYAIQAYVNFNEYNDGDRDSVLNMAYNVLVFVPFLLQLKNRVVKFITVAISVLYIIISLKRGAIVTFIAMMFIYFLLSARDRRGNVKGISFKQFAGGFLGVCILLVVVNMVDTNMGGALSSRFSLEAIMFGSTRNELYAAAWQDIASRPLFTLLIGKGSGSSLRIIGNGVHNELLEFLFSYGIIGMGFYITTAINGIIRIRDIYNENGQRYSVPGKIFAMGITYMIMVGLFGSALFSHMFYHIMLAMGLANCPVALNKEGCL